ncbi:MAG: hypothetical protein ABL867_11935 [Rickettsiales bacterium]
MKKVSLILASLLIISSSAYARTPEERGSAAADSHHIRALHHELRQEIRENRQDIRESHKEIRKDKRTLRKARKHHDKKTK